MENTQLEVAEIKKEETALYLLTKAEIDTQIATAKAFPRSLTVFRQKAMGMATFSPEVAASCTYALPRGGKSLQGPSIRLAEIVAACYGNNQYGGRVIANDGREITAQGIFMDLENNTRVTVEVKRSITDSKGQVYNRDMQTLTGNAATAIAIRNAILKGIPGALVADIQTSAKEVARGTAATLPERSKKAVEYFKGLGVTEKQICEVLEIVKIGDIDLDKLETLTGMKAAIANQETTVADLFDKAIDNKKEAAKSAQQSMAEKLKHDGE